MVYYPPKYYKGLLYSLHCHSKKNKKRCFRLYQTKKAQRLKEIKHFGKKSWKNTAAYKGFKTDIGVKTKSSHYTKDWYKLFPDAKSLEEKAKVTGVPLKQIKESYNRGMAAWRTGHRPGATEQQWGYARVHSMLLCGKTHYSTDADLVRKARTTRKGKKWFQRCPQ
jgi:hypothetical protein